MDYEGVGPGILRFDESVSAMDYPITILDDSMGGAEAVKEFTVHLEALEEDEGQVIIREAVATIRIMDDDRE